MLFRSTKGWVRNALGLIVRDKGEDFFKNHIVISNVSKKVRKILSEGLDEVIV